MSCSESNEVSMIPIIKQLVGHLESLELPGYNEESVSH